MLKFFLLFLVSFSAYGQGDLSGNLRSQFNNTRLNFGNLQVPNNQATKTGAINALIETGNKNILSNPGFEHSTASTGWTITGTATTSTETAAPLAGLKSFRADMTAQTFNLKQTTTIYAAARAGSQMFARIQIKNTAPGCTMYIVKNSVRQTGSNDQLAISTDGVTRTYELAFLADGTSNGFEVDCTSTTGVIITDEGELSTESSAFVDVAQIGPWIDAGTIGITAVTSNPTKGTVVQDKLRYRINGENLELNFEYQQTSAGGADGSGVYLFAIPSGYFIDTANFPANTSITNDSLANDRVKVGEGTLTQSAALVGSAGVYIYDSTRLYVKFNIAADATGVASTSSISGNAFGSGTNPLSFSGNIGFRLNASVKVQGLSNKVSTYSQFAVSDVSVENVFSAKVSAAGVVSDENLDWINGNCIASSSTYTCTFNTAIFTVTPNCVATPISSATGTQVLSSALSSVINTWVGGSGTAGPFVLTCTKQGADFKAKNVITGSFQGIEKCADPYECTDTFSARFSDSGAIVTQNLDWINGNCTQSPTGNYTCNFRSGIFTVNPSCFAMPLYNPGNDGAAAIHGISTTSIGPIEFVANNSNFSTPFTLICQKQGVDFRPKTAVAGTFLDSVTAPNTVKVKTCYYAFGGAGATLASPTECTTGTCTEVYDNCGAGTPPSRTAAGAYENLTFANGTWANSTPIKCECTGYDGTSTNVRECNPYFITPDNTWASTALGGFVGNFATSSVAGVFDDTYVQVECSGIAP